MKTIRFLYAIIIFCLLSGLFSGRLYACNQSPVAAFHVREYEIVNRAVHFDGSQSYDPDSGDSITKYEWDFDGNGTYDYYETSTYAPDGAFDGKTTHKYTATGTYTVKLRVTDSHSATNTITHIVRVSNDTDNDGLPDGWETNYFGNLNDSWNTDHDSDVYNNLSEYLHESNPNNSGSVPSVNVTIYVVDDVNSIQKAVDESRSGDTIIVGEGTYYETLDFRGKPITITSTAPGNWSVVGATIIDANDPNARVVKFDETEGPNSVLKGFTIVGGDVGIYCEDSSPTVSNCLIMKNGNGENPGGGIYDYNSPISLKNCFVVENDANYGGGIYIYNSAPTLINCVLSSNNASIVGGGLYDYNSSPKIINCTLSKNTAYYDGGGIYSEGSSSDPNLVNSIVWGNNAGNSGDEIFNADSADPNYKYCDIGGSGGSNNWDPDYGYNDGNNIDVSPKFADINNPVGLDKLYGTDDDGLTLRADSLCIDAGSNTEVNSLNITTAILGNNRKVDGDHNNTTVTDIGAYETPRIWFVDKDISGGNGKSWSSAYSKLQDALTASGSGDQIWVAEGTYKPTSNTDRTNSFVMVSGVSIYGGFSGGETGLSDRSWRMYKSVLSGDIGTINDINDNSYHVVTGANNAVLDGFTITAGNANYSYYMTNEQTAGGGMYNGSCSPIVRNCIFYKNNAYYFGGGLYNYQSSPTIINCLFINNTANSYSKSRGGAISGHLTTSIQPPRVPAYPAVSTLQSNPKIINCTFSGNNGYYGGAFSEGHSATVQNCIFWGDHVTSGTDELYDTTGVNFSYSDVKNSGGSSNWNTNFGVNGGGNIDSSPRFIDMNNPAGSDGIFVTLDDGLRLNSNSPCIDAANGSVAPVFDILGFGRVDFPGVNNTGTGSPKYADMGAFECYVGFDGDNDGMPDEWEIVNNLDPKDSNDSGLDPDNDGLTNLQEYQAHTSPHNPDTDGDGMPDGWEVAHGLNPLVNDASGDADNDGLTNLNEYIHNTDPHNSDTDNDGMPDGWEVSHGFNPVDANDAYIDSDGDGMPNGWEVAHGLNPFVNDANADPDNDGLNNLSEYIHNTDPHNSDTDGDGMPDGWEVNHGLNPASNSDAAIDSDNDGLTNVQEYQAGTDPHNTDSDGDGMPDGWEKAHGLNPANANDANLDKDNDGFSNFIEYIHNSDPNNINNLPQHCTITVPTVLATIQSAIDCSINGDTIVVMQGTYYESIDFKGKSITIRSKDPNNWDVVRTTVINVDSSSVPVVDFHNGENSNSVLQGFSLTGGKDGVSCSSSSSPKITQCIIGGCDANGISCLSGSPLIANNMIGSNVRYGINSSSSTPPTIKNNWIYSNSRGINFSLANSAALVRNNTIVANTNNGIYVVSGTAPAISNCILWNNNDDLSGCSATYSCIQNNDSGIGNIHSNPQFIAAPAVDCRLNRTSPCLNAGDPNQTYTGEKDIEGQVRNANRVDIGADEICEVHNKTKNIWYSSIQLAINGASNSDIVEVYEWAFYEAIHFNGVNIKLTSIDPNDWRVVENTIIDANNVNADVVSYHSYENAGSVLKGFTLKGGNNGVYCSNYARPVIRNCIITDNNSNGIKCVSGAPLLTNNKIGRNNGDGIYSSSYTAPTIEYSWIYANKVGIRLIGGGALAAWIQNNTIADNVDGGIYKVSGANPNINSCIIWGHYSNDLINCNAVYSCIEDVNDASGVGNITENPLFIDRPNYDYHVSGASPCRQAGDPNIDRSTSRDIDNVLVAHHMMGADNTLVWYVNCSVAENGTGVSWSSPYKDLQYALQTADGSDPRPQEIWVAKGYYYPTSGNNRNATFRLLNGIIIRGGFAGDGREGSDITKRDFQANQTVLSGDIGIPNEDYDNSYHVVTADNVGSTTILDGFTITGGNADASGNDSGGGIIFTGVCSYEFPKIYNCSFSGNSAVSGGGLYLNNSSVNVRNTTFFGNEATYGGGICNLSGAVSLINCVIAYNESTYGGGEYMNYSWDVLYNCTFVGNISSIGSGIYSHLGSLDIYNSIFWDNPSGTEGYQIYLLYDLMGSSWAGIFYSDIQGGKDSIYSRGSKWRFQYGTNNVNDAPKFIDEGNPAGPDGIFGTYDDGLALNMDSPCIDAGSNGYVDSLCITTDILGRSRKVDGNLDGTITVDMGAYEAQKVIYVDKDATGPTFNGSTWSNAFKYLKDALAAAEAGDEIWVAEGTYYPGEDATHSRGSIDRSAVFQLKDNVAVYGGFTGTEAGCEHRNGVSTHNTILSGDIDLSGGNDSYCVVAGVNWSIIDGLTISGGGTGISSNANTAFTINNCMITDNGDGIVCSSSSLPTISNNSICNNTGNGIYVNMAAPTIRNNRVYNNNQGILCNASTVVSIINNTIAKNIDRGIKSSGSQAPVIKNCILWGNGTDFDGCSSTYSCFKSSNGTNNNIWYFPYFVNIDGNDFHLRDYSPCIDSGDPTSPYSKEPMPNGDRVDMGAYGNTSEATSQCSYSNGLPDSWEMEHFGNLSQVANGNSDTDGLTNIEEYRNGTKPNNADTDGDGMPDGWEVTYGLNPLDTGDAKGDPDGDGKTNLMEYLSGSFPNNRDVITVSPTTTIQAAINACTHTWDVVEIPPGTYTGTGNYDVDFGTHVVTVRSQDPAHPAIIDCGGSHRAFYFYNGQISDSVVSGLIIRNGYSTQKGGAIFCENGSSPTIENCQFIGNSSGVSGGAIYNDNSSPVITNCVFLRNYANTANGNGGAIYNNENSNPTITSCTIASNGAKAGLGGGIYNETGSSPVITNSILWDNFDKGNVYFSEYFASNCTSGFGSSCYTDWTVVGATGSWKVENNILKQINNSSNETYTYYKNGTSWSNFRVKMKMLSWDDDEHDEDNIIGIMFRYNKDSSNYYRFSWNRFKRSGHNAQGHRRLEKRFNGTLVTIAEDSTDYFPYNPGQSYQLEIVADGSRLEVFIDNIFVFSAVDYDLSAGTIAAYCWKNDSAKFDNIEVSGLDRTERDELAQINGGTPDVSYSCIQNNNLLDASVPFRGMENGNTKKEPEFLGGASCSGLIAYWPFNETSGSSTAKDPIGDHTGTVTGTPGWNSNGQVGGRLNFDGSTNFVSLSPTSFSNLEGGFTVSLWAYPTNNGSWARFIDFGNGAPSDNILFARNGTSSDLTFQVYNGGTAGTVTATGAIETGKWQFFVATVDASGNAAIYKDGNSVATGTTYVPANVVRNYNYMGKSNWTTTGDALYQGSMDELMIFNRALSASEVRKLYLSGYNHIECDLRLSIDSPCVDAGRNDAIGEDVAKDISEINNRILDGDNDGQAVIDMGAYEFKYDTWWSFGKVSQWSFEETSGAALDPVNHNDGTLNGNAHRTNPNDGKIGRALAIDGDGDYVETVSATGIPVGAKPFTITAWIYPTEIRRGSITYWGASSSTNNSNILRTLNNQRLPEHGGDPIEDKDSEHGGLRHDFRGNYLDWKAPADFINNWYHVAITFDGVTRKMFVDGALVASDTPAGTINVSSSNVKIGKGLNLDNKGNPKYFEGTIDEVNIYNRALSNKEIGLLSGNHPPVLSHIGDQTVVEGDTLTFTLKASDQDGDEITYSEVGLPSGVLEGDRFSWTPSSHSQSGQQVEFTASDNRGGQASETITITVEEDQLAGYWSFDETNGDVAHSGSYAVVSGAAWTPGKYGNALNFAGTDYVECINSDALNFGTNSFTIAAWIKTSGASDDQAIFDKRDSAAGRGYYLFVGSGSMAGKIKAGMRDNEAHEVSVVSTDTVNNEWHHVAAVYGSGGITVYIDGQPKGNVSSSIGSIDSSVNAFIGKSSYDTTGFFNGKIDEVIIYSPALNGTEILGLYNNGMVSGKQPVGYWNFDEGAGEKAYDSAGSMNQSGTVFGVQRGVGRIGNCLKFDGIRDYVQLPTTGFDNFSTGFSVALWAYPTITGSSYTGSWARFIDFGDVAKSSDIFFARNATSNKLTFQVYPGDAVTTNNDQIELNKWQFFVATVDSSGHVVIYKNGSSVPTTGTTNAPANPLNVYRTQNYIGKSNWIADADYQGGLDEVMIFNRVLGSPEVQDIYNKGLDGVSGDNPISYWNFEETSGNVVQDIKGGKNGTIKPVSQYTGKVGNALKFDGSGYVSVPTLDGAYGSSDDFTVTAWFEIGSSDIANKNPIIGQWNYSHGDDRGWEILVDNGTLKAFFSDGRRSNTLSKGGVSANIWHYVALVHNATSNQTKLYLDGSSSPSSGTNCPISSYSTKFRIGYGPDHAEHGSKVYLKGFVDETMVFDRALIDDDVSRLYSNGSGTGGFDGLSGTPPITPIAYWKFDETGGPFVDDSQHNHNGTYNGVLVAASWADGETGNALDLTGDTDYVQLQSMTGAYYSIGFWAKFSDAGNSNERIVDFKDGGTNTFVISRSSTPSQLSYVNGPCSATSDTGFIVSSEWHYYTVVHIVEGSNKRILFYRDGIQYGAAVTTTCTLSSSYTWTSCYIGSNNTGNGNYFKGLLDELRIYTRSLSDTEVEQLATDQHSPVMTPIGSKSIEAGNLLTFSVSASDGDDDIVNFSVDNLPSGAKFNGRTFSWIPTASQVGNYRLTFTASDGVFTDTEAIIITVAASTGSPQGATKAVSGALGNDLALQVDPFTGSASYNIPIALPPARQGTEPAVALNYSGGGNGLCGFGWSLSGGGAIQRDTRHGVPKRNGANYYDDDKGFVVSFASVSSRLVLINSGTNEYRAETDQAFLKYIFDKSNNQWIVTDRSGNTFYFGQVTGEGTENVGALMTHPLFTGSSAYQNAFMWALAKIIDINKNTTYFDYVFDSGQMYLKRIRYNGNLGVSPETAVKANNTVEFVLEDRTDTSISYAMGNRVESNKRLSEIVVKVSDQLVRRYKLDYEVSPSSRHSLLHAVTVFGTDNVSSLPPVVFEYQTASFEFGPVQDWGPIDSQGAISDKNWNSPSATGSKDTYVELLDINGDGLPDRVMRAKDSPYDVFKVQLNTGEGFEKDAYGNYITRNWGPVQCQGKETETDWGSIQGIDSGDDGVVMLFDIDGDGLPDRVMRNNISTPYPNLNKLKVQFNTGVGFDAFTTDWTNIKNQDSDSDNGWNGVLGADNSGNDTQVMICDIDGNGLPDRVMRNKDHPTQSFKVQLNNGNGSFADPIDWGPKDAQGNNTNTWNSPNGKEINNGNSYVVVSLLDLNGDGLPDRVMRKIDTTYTVLKVQFNTGYGFEADAAGNPVLYDWGPLFTQGNDTSEMWGSLQSTDSSGNAFVMLFDINADGLPDRVMRTDVGGSGTFAYPNNVFKVQLNTGSGFEKVARLWKNIDNQGHSLNGDKNWNSPYGVDGEGAVAMLFDINGDGLPDRVMRNSSASYGPPNNVFKVQLNKGPVPDLLKKVHGRLGGEVELTYMPSTRYDNTDNNGKSKLPFPVQTVSSITARDGLGTESTITYKYSRGCFNTDRREFMGFGRVEVTDPYGAKTVTYFHQGGGYDDSQNGEFEDEGNFAKKGIPYRVEAYGSDGKLYSRTINKVEQSQLASGKDWYFAYIKNSITMDYEGLDTYLAKATESAYDASGRIIEAIDYGAVENVNIANHSFTTVAEYPAGHTNYILHTHTVYHTFTNTDILSKVDSVWTAPHENNTYGHRLTETKYTYDDYGNLTQQDTWFKDETRDITNVRSYYDMYGNKRVAVDTVVGIITATKYDDTYQTFPVRTVTGMDTSTSFNYTTFSFPTEDEGDKYITTAEYDERSGLVKTATDVMNIKSQNYYDAFFRLTDIKVGTSPGADPSLLVTRVEYNLGGIENGEVSRNFIRQRYSGYEAYIYNDGLGRVVQTRSKAETGAAGEYRVSDVCYDERGSVYFATKIFFSSGSDFTLWDDTVPGVLTEYDSLGRVSSVISSHDDGDDSPLGEIATEYKDGINQWARIAVDPKGKITKTHFDARGNVVELIEVIGAPGDNDDITTTYYYDELGRQWKTVDKNNHSIIATYDSLGRKIQTDDLDMGTWHYVYDDAGRLVEQRDGRDNKIELIYTPDQLGRLVQKKVYAKVSGNYQLKTTIDYAYDNYSGKTGYDSTYPGYKGLIYQVKKSDASGNPLSWRKFGYDSRGRNYKTGQRITEKREGEYVTTTEFDDAGRVTYIHYPSDEPVVIHYSYGTAGELTSVSSVSGVHGSPTFYQTQGYDEDGKAIGVNYGNGTRTQYEYYEYSKRLKRIHTLKDSTDLQDLAYTFDKSSNITSITDAVYTETESGSIRNVLYDDLDRLISYYSAGQNRTVNFAYDDLGNILMNGDFSDSSYAYDSKPHAVASVAAPGGTRYYQYDASGNMTSRDVSDGTQALTYDEENQLTRVTKGTSPDYSLDVQYGYEYDGSRLWKKDVLNDRMQIWVGSLYEEKYDPISDKTLKLCHVYAGGQLVATFEPASSWSCLVKNTPVLAQLSDIGSTICTALFGDGRTPFSIMGFAVLAGLAIGLYYTRRRLAAEYGLEYGGWLSRAFYNRDPWRQTIIMLIIAAVTLCGFPQQALAGTPADRPVFYYYHSDHLGSSSIITDSAGAVVQHYEYMAFGNERYHANTQAFSVTNRYTGQDIDEDTGLYYYGSRYYDPELARFVQADTVVPDSTSQALNRYAYVANNPFKFTDPTGHSWLSKLWDSAKKYIGTIVTVSLTLMGVPVWVSSIIGSAVGTVVNHGTFASFAIGVGIGIAAGYIAAPFGDSIGSFAQGFGALKDAIGYALKGALQGAISGAISSAVYGQNIWQGMGEGALGGAIGGGIALATAAVIGGGAQVARDLGVLPNQGGYPSIVAAMAACMLMISGPSLVRTMDMKSIAEFANAWLASWDPIRDVSNLILKIISPEMWDQYLEGVRKQAKGVAFWKPWAPIDFDTKLPDGAELLNNSKWYLIESLGRFARGSEINYVGVGMLENRLGYNSGACWKYPYAHKFLMMGLEKVIGQIGYRPYAWPNRNELFFNRYGFDNY